MAAAAALKARAWELALEHLEQSPAAVTPGERARTHAYRAQALEGLGRLIEAERAAGEAIREAKREEGRPGVPAIRALQTGILAALAAQEAARRAKEDDAPLAEQADEALALAPDGPALLIRRANVLLDLGRSEEAYRTARKAWQGTEASARDRVLAALTLARCPGSEGPADWIRRAHEIADLADDQNLMTAVAKAARSAGVTLRVIS